MKKRDLILPDGGEDLPKEYYVKFLQLNLQKARHAADILKARMEEAEFYKDMFGELVDNLKNEYDRIRPLTEMVPNFRFQNDGSGI